MNRGALTLSALGATGAHLALFGFMHTPSVSTAVAQTAGTQIAVSYAAFDEIVQDEFDHVLGDLIQETRAKLPAAPDAQTVTGIFEEEIRIEEDLRIKELEHQAALEATRKAEEEARRAEEARKAEAERQAEEARKGEAAQKAEAQKQAEAATRVNANSRNQQSASAPSAKPAPQPAPTATQSQLAAYAKAVRHRFNKIKKPRVNGRGQVEIRFTLSANGQIQSLGIARSSGNPALDQAAIHAVSQTGGFPAAPDGKPHSFSIPIVFQ